eukprot:s588_g5.t1
MELGQGPKDQMQLLLQQWRCHPRIPRQRDCPTEWSIYKRDSLAQRRAEREDRRHDRLAGAKPKENAATGKVDASTQAACNMEAELRRALQAEVAKVERREKELKESKEEMEVKLAALRKDLVAREENGEQLAQQATTAEATATELRKKLQGQEAQMVRSQAEMAKAQRGEKELKEEMEVKFAALQKELRTREELSSMLEAEVAREEAAADGRISQRSTEDLEEAKEAVLAAQHAAHAQQEAEVQVEEAKRSVGKQTVAAEALIREAEVSAERRSNEPSPVACNLWTMASQA